MRHLVFALCLLCLGGVAARAEPIALVAGENFYGDIAAQIGGPDVAVASILSNPDQDPHLFEASTATARLLAGARIVVMNGIGYDPWLEKLLSASANAKRETITIAALTGHKDGDNPHLWYDPATMPRFAEALAERLGAIDPDHRDDYQRRLAAFHAAFAPLTRMVGAMKRAHAGTPVTATEPVFGYMAAALGLAMHNERFQYAVMNDTEPGASDIAAFERDLRRHRVRVLLYNSQTSGSIATRMQAVAKEAGVPIVGVSETEPAGMTYQDWMLSQLVALEAALARK